MIEATMSPSRNSGLNDELRVPVPDQAQVRSSLGVAGFVVLPEQGPFDHSMRWQAFEELFGELYFVTRMSVRCLPGATSYTSTSVAAELHTDYTGFWIPPDVQLLECVHPAREGGLVRLGDAFAIADALVAEGLELSALCADPMEGAFNYPTRWPLLSWVFGRPMALVSPGVCIGPDGLTTYARERGLVIEIKLQAGDLLVLDNHRMLHGRTAFEDVARLFNKYHLWSCDSVTGLASLDPLLAREVQALEPTTEGGFDHIPSSYDATSLDLLRDLFSSMDFPIIDLDRPGPPRSTLDRLLEAFAHSRVMSRGADGTLEMERG